MPDSISVCGEFIAPPLRMISSANTLKGLAAALGFYSHGALALEQDAMHHHIAAYGQVQPVAHLRQVGEGGAHSHAVDVVERARSNSGGFGVVLVHRLREARVKTRGPERLRARIYLFSRIAFDGYRTLGTMEVIAAKRSGRSHSC